MVVRGRGDVSSERGASVNGVNLEMAPRTGKRLQDRGRDTPTKDLLWSPKAAAGVANMGVPREALRGGSLEKAPVLDPFP